MSQDDFQPSDTLREQIDSVQAQLMALKQEAGKVIVGQHNMLDLLLVAMLADGHVLLEGVPGVAKTLTVRVLSALLRLPFSRVQFTPDLMPSDVLGTSIFSAKTNDFEFRPGPIFSNLILIDEINRAPAKTQSALFEVMEERQATIDGTRHPMSPPFMVIATQNPVEHEGTYRLPEAQLDRFLFKIEVGYPELEEEVSILQKADRLDKTDQLRSLQQVLGQEQIIRMRQLCTQVRAEQAMLAYIANIMQTTRKHPSILLGASPRASIACLSAAKAAALLRGADYITPDDVRFVLDSILNHRLIMTPEAEMEGETTKKILEEIVKAIEVPR